MVSLPASVSGVNSRLTLLPIKLAFHYYKVSIVCDVVASNFFAINSQFHSSYYKLAELYSNLEVEQNFVSLISPKDPINIYKYITSCIRWEDIGDWRY